MENNIGEIVTLPPADIERWWWRSRTLVARGATTRAMNISARGTDAMVYSESVV